LSVVEEGLEREGGVVLVPRGERLPFGSFQKQGIVDTNHSLSYVKAKPETEEAVQRTILAEAPIES